MILVTWDAPDSGSLSHYIVTRRHEEAGDVVTVTYRVGSTSTSYQDSDVDFGNTYEYAVTAHFNALTPTDTPTATATATPTATVEGDISPDRDALVALYNATRGPSWTDDDNWLSSKPIGTWYGVTTDANGRVTELRLAGNRLYGPPPAELGDLEELTYLDLSDNWLNDPIPAEWGDLDNLTHLDLHDTHLGGRIPAALGNLDSLSYLDLNFSELGGSIPAELGNLDSLTHLDLGHNGLNLYDTSRLG